MSKVAAQLRKAQANLPSISELTTHFREKGGPLTIYSERGVIIVPVEEITEGHVREWLAARAAQDASYALTLAEPRYLLEALGRMYDFSIPRTPTGKLQRKWLEKLYATAGEIAVERAEAA